MMDFNPSECKDRVQQLPEYLREVLKRLACGHPTKQIAAELDVTESTVRVYRERLYSKLGANNLATATRIAVSAGVV